jgi:hypothetical protein
MEQDLNALTQHWYERTRTVEKAHFTRCALFRQRHVKLGCVTIVCTTLLGVLSNLDPDHGTINLDFFGRTINFDVRKMGRAHPSSAGVIPERGVFHSGCG